MIHAHLFELYIHRSNGWPLWDHVDDTMSISAWHAREYGIYCLSWSGYFLNDELKVPAVQNYWRLYPLNHVTEMMLEYYYEYWPDVTKPGHLYAVLPDWLKQTMNRSSFFQAAAEQMDMRLIVLKAERLEAPKRYKEQMGKGLNRTVLFQSKLQNELVECNATRESKGKLLKSLAKYLSLIDSIQREFEMQEYQKSNLSRVASKIAAEHERELKAMNDAMKSELEAEKNKRLELDSPQWVMYGIVAGVTASIMLCMFCICHCCKIDRKRPLGAATAPSVQPSQLEGGRQNGKFKVAPIKDWKSIKMTAQASDSLENLFDTATAGMNY